MTNEIKLAEIEVLCTMYCPDCGRKHVIDYMPWGAFECEQCGCEFEADK